MIENLLWAFVCIALAMPLMVIVLQRNTIKISKYATWSAVCYLFFVVNEILFLIIGKPFYFGHVFFDALLLSATVLVVSAPSLNWRQHLVRNKLSYSFLLIAAAAILLWHLIIPSHVTGQVIVLVLALFFISTVILISSLEDASVPYIRILLFWLLCYFGTYQQNAILNGILALLFFWMVSLHILHFVVKRNYREFEATGILRRARNVVFSMLSDISSTGKRLPSLDYTIIRILETIIDTISVKGAAVYTIEHADGSAGSSKATIRFTQSAGIFWALHADDELALSRPTFDKEDLKKKSFQMGEGIIGKVAETAEAISLDVLQDAELMRSQGINTGNISNIIAVVLKINEKPLGVLVVQNRIGEESFSPADRHLLQSLADQAAIPINNVRLYAELQKTERLRQEMNIAADIQRQLLPTTVPVLPNLGIAAFMQPAKEVGGDYYDFISLNDFRQGITIGDVSGKGLPAGMTMVVAKTVLNLVAPQQPLAKDVIISFTAEMYPRMRRSQFMTLNYMIWDDATRLLSYAGAGHEHILWYHAQTKVTEKIKVGGIAAGLVDDCKLMLKKGDLATLPGDVIVLYTDGITEARNKNEDMFTLPRLIDSLQNHAQLGDVDAIMDAIKEDVFDFISGAEQYDDITMMVFLVK